MKRIIYFLILSIISIAFSVDSSAADFAVDNSEGVSIYYKWINNKSELEVSYAGNNPWQYNNEYSGDIIIPEIVEYEGKSYSVTSIGIQAFSKCDQVTSITIPKSIRHIGAAAFEETEWYNKQPEGIVYVGKCVYQYKGTMPENTSIILEEGTLGIASGAFSNCSGLISITIPSSVVFINEHAFDGCNNLASSITIPDGVRSIPERTFASCSSLTSITLPNSVTSIGNGAFGWCKQLRSISLSSNLVFIDEEAFAYCSGLTSISIPNSVSFIGKGAFHSCSGLVYANIPNSLTEISDFTFAHCNSLKEIVIPNGVTSIGSKAFRYCRNLTSLSLPASITYIDIFAFDDCAIKSLYIEDLSAWCKIKLEDTTSHPLNTKGGQLFLNNSELKQLEFPQEITSIKDYSFYNCSSITSVSFHNGVNSIGEQSFEGCVNLASISLPENISIINKQTFKRCSSLKSITIPYNVEVIYQEAFSGCNQLESVNSLPLKPPFLYDNSFSDFSIPLKVPKGCKEVYQTAPGWQNFTNISDANKYRLTYIVDGEQYKSYEIEEGMSITPEAEPAKEGYTFSGWSDIPKTMPEHDVTVTGTFTINKYKLTYTVDGEEYKSYELDYGASITLETTPTKEGYTFSGWSEIPATMPAKDVTVTGTFTINKYKLTYMVDGAEYKSYEIEYGAKITPEAEPTKEGYSFSGWSSIPETMPAKDVVVTGTFTKGAYKLTYMVDGEVYKTVTYNYGDAITPEPAPTKEGYTFSGWSEIPSTMPAKDVTVTGTFTINKYKLTYMVDGAEYKSYEIEYGAKITPEAEPTKEGYSFSGWSSIPETMPAKDVVVTGTFTKGAYKLTYIVDGEVYKTVSYDYGATITPEAAPTKEGYTFSGWSEIPQTMPAKDVTITGTFTINKYKLTYMVDGAEYKSYEIEYGAKITPEAEPTKEGYSFSGWSSIPETMPAKDVVVTGSFSKGTYKLTYMVDGQVYKTVSYDYGATITPEAAPTKEGYTFSGWSEIPQTMPAKDVTVTGTFTINKYKLTYMVDGAEYKSYEIEYGAKITPEAEPTKEGYSFSGWSSIPETMPAKDVVVTGTFTKGAYKLTYMVDGEVYKTVSYDYGATITPEAAPTKEGYSFSGWSDIPQTMPAKDVTVTGSFTINKYKLTYMVDGAEYKSYEIEYGAKITPEAEPTKEGYSFSGWNSIPETMPAKDVVVTGTFTKGAYKLTYIVDGEVYKTVSYDFGATITPETAPTKEGYTFSGWSEIPQTMPAKDVTVTGSFTINKYKLTYMVDGAEYKSYEIEYGAKITPEAWPTKKGYTFSGWSDIPETMPAYDVVVTGTFTQNEQTTEITVDDVTYDITGEGTVTITGSEQTGEVTIESTVEINGQTYNVTAIADNTFKNNTDITSVTIDEGITSIGDNAFDGCSSLIVINIGKDVNSIGNKAFANVGTAAARTRGEGAILVNCYAESVPQTALDAFENTPIETGTLMVEDNSVNAYKATSPWSRFERILGFDEAAGINSISIDSANARIYDMQGNRLDNPQKGVNIIRTRDGKTKKMIVK